MEILHIKKCNCSVRDYFLFVSNQEDFKITVNYISMDCKCIREKYDFDISTIDDYKCIKDEIEKFEGGEGKLKGVIFDLFKIEPFKKRYEFCHFWKTFCNRAGIPYQFINSSTLLITSILCSAQINTVSNYLMTLVHISKNYIQIFDLENYVYCYDSDPENYYMNYRLKEISKLDVNCTDNEFKDAVMKGESHKVIISHDDPKNTRNFKIKSKKVMVLKNQFSNYIFQSLKAIINQLLDVCGNNLEILAYFERDLCITKQQNFGKCYGSFEMKCSKTSILPYFETIDTFVSSKENVAINIWNGETFESMEIFDLSKYQNSYARLTLLIDENGFYDLTIEKAETLPGTTESTRQPDAFISLNDDEISFTVSEISYKISLPPIISFFQESLPLVGEDAKSLAAKYPSFVVYDIFSLTKMAYNGNFKINPKWGFKVEKDSDGSLRIVFDTWRGERKERPQFLIALLISYLFKSAKECIGFRPKTVHIQIGDNFKWIVNGVTEALKIFDNKYDIKTAWTEKLIKIEML